MKRELSFYEFVGIMIPGVIFLFSVAKIYEAIYMKSIIDFSQVGESLVFFIIAYGTGHILQAAGNIFEFFFWKVFGGMPSQWLMKKNWLGMNLFDLEQTEKIKNKIYQKFGKKIGRDYGMDVYNWLSLKEKITEKRIDIFNANYSLFRGLTVSFYILAIITFIYLDWKFILIPLIFGVLSNYRMFRFARHYSKELFRSYLNYE